MTEGTELDQISKTHDWRRDQLDCPTCKKCGMTPISAHIWGDDEWTAYAVRCGEKLSSEALEEEKRREWRRR